MKLTGKTDGYPDDFYAEIRDDKLHLYGGEYGLILDDESRAALGALCDKTTTSPPG